MGRNFTRKRGGTFLGQGSYGCAFIPTIACEGEVITAGDSISKLMRCEDAYDEYSGITNILKRIDPDQQYFLYPKRICKVDLDSSAINKADIAKCGFSGVLRDSLQRNKTAKKMSQRPLNPCSAFPEISKESPVSIQYLYGGKDLYEGMFPGEDRAVFMEDLNNLFEGLTLLHANGYVHFDIKRENSVALKEPNGHYKIRFIDFGFLTLPVKFNPGRFDPSGLYYYKFYPYDVRFLNIEFSERNIVPNDISQWYKVKVDSVVRDGLPIESISSVNQNSMIRLFRDLKSITFPERKDMIMKKADVFMLGIILAEVYKDFFGASPSLSANPATTSYKVANLVFHMTDGNVLDRYTADEAYQAYRSIFPRTSRPAYTAAHPPPPPPKKTPPRPMRVEEITPPLPPPPPRIPPTRASYEKMAPPPKMLPRTPPQNEPKMVKTPPNPYEKTFQAIEKSLEENMGIDFRDEINRIAQLYWDILSVNPSETVNRFLTEKGSKSTADFRRQLLNEVMKLRRVYASKAKFQTEKTERNRLIAESEALLEQEKRWGRFVPKTKKDRKSNRKTRKQRR